MTTHSDEERGNTLANDIPPSESGARDNPGMAAWRPISIQLSCLLVGVILHNVWPAAIPVSERVRWVFVVVFIAMGAAIIAFSFREFFRAKTSLRPDQGAKALIHTGPFRYSRNPLYLAVIFLIIGIGFGVDNVWIIAMVVPLIFIMSVAVIAREEKYLEREFGQEYLDFKKSVRRWI